MARPIQARSGKVTIEIDAALQAQVDAMVRGMAPAVSDALDAYLDKAEAYVQQEYPRPGDARFPTATGNSPSASRNTRTSGPAWPATGCDAVAISPSAVTPAATDCSSPLTTAARSLAASSV